MRIQTIRLGLRPSVIAVLSTLLFVASNDHLAIQAAPAQDEVEQEVDRVFDPLDVRGLPFPPDTMGLEFDSVFNGIEFSSHSPLTALAAFYRSEMAERGWQEDAAAATEDDETIEMLFKRKDAEVDMELDLGSKGIVTISMDTEGLTWIGTDDPASLVAAGLPQPRAYLYLQKNVPPPGEVRDLRYEDDGYKCKSDLTKDELFSDLSRKVVGLGFKESRRPILTDTRSYTEFKKGSESLSVNIFTHEEGSRAVVEYENTKAEAVASPLPAVASSNIPAKPGATTEADSVDQPKPATAKRRVVNVSKNKGAATVWHGSDKYEFKHVAAYRSDYWESTILIFSDQPIPLQAMQKMITENEEDFSFFDLYEFDLPSYLKVSLGEYTSFSFSASGLGIGRGIEDPKKDIKIEADRVAGTVKMEPEDIFDKPFRFEVSIDAGIMAADTQLGDAPADPVSSNPSLRAAGDLPVPDAAEGIGSGGSQYYRYLETEVKMSLAEVTEFYRRELAAKKWQENTDQQETTNGTSQFVWESEQGKMTLRLGRSNNRTTINLVFQDAVMAKADGLLPEAGKARLVMGNANSKEIVISIGKTDYKVKAGLGADSPAEGLNYSVAPGKYTLTIKIPGESPQRETLEIAEGTTWGVIGLPNGSYYADRLY